ncbi:MAG TPA: ankyrin repeat domain-containing protein [Bacteroidales bacterium]|nr:ankyrin repeat domain-containing protein [Bacteroidales bacterium]
MKTNDLTKSLVFVSYLRMYSLVLLLFLLNITGRAGEIHDAVKKGNLEKVKSILLKNLSLLNATDNIGYTPLGYSAAYAQWDVLQYLLECGAEVNIITKINDTPVHCSCYYDRPDIVELLLTHGGNECLKVRDIYGGYTPLLRAVQRGCKGVVSLLIEKGASPDEVTNEGWNALHLAAKCGHKHLYELLIGKGVSWSAIDKEGRTPMEYDFCRPAPIKQDPGLLEDYIGRYTLNGDPVEIGIEIYREDNIIILDDNSLNELYPIGEDLFYCDQDPWTIRFYRNNSGAVERIELIFLRRNVLLYKIK